jgi:hypothetical protein
MGFLLVLGLRWHLPALSGAIVLLFGLLVPLTWLAWTLLALGTVLILSQIPVSVAARRAGRKIGPPN